MKLRSILMFILHFPALALAQSRDRYIQDVDSGGPAGMLIAAPFYWFIALHYLKSTKERMTVAAILIGICIFVGQIALVSALVGVTAAYMIYGLQKAAWSVSYKWPKILFLVATAAIVWAAFHFLPDAIRAFKGMLRHI